LIVKYEGSERIMDSKDQEKRKVGIQRNWRKNTSMMWKDYRINIVDHHLGHADSCEVERVLSMLIVYVYVDCC